MCFWIRLFNIQLNLERLLERMWDYMGLIRVYTKRRGAPPDFREPLVLSSERRGVSVEVRVSANPYRENLKAGNSPWTTHPNKQTACESISKELLDIFSYALVWGRSTKYDPQRCGLQHEVSHPGNFSELF